MEPPNAFFGLSPQNFFLKKFIFSLKKYILKKCLIFSQKAFPIFPEMEACTFRPEFEKIKKSILKKIPYISGNATF